MLISLATVTYTLNCYTFFVKMNKVDRINEISYVLDCESSVNNKDIRIPTNSYKYAVHVNN